MDIVIKLQQTGIATMIICFLVVWADKREAEQVPFLKMAGTILTLVVSVATIIVTTYLRIWL